MFIKRKLLPFLKQYLPSPEALIVTGFRRVGKTTLMRHLFDTLPTGNKLFLDLESPVNQRIFQQDNYDAIAADLKNMGLSFTQRPYVCIDEIQFVKTIPSIVKYLFDHYHIKFLLTGSSSFYLKHHFTESLAGRKFLFELRPLDFEEFLWFKGEKIRVSAPYKLLRPLYDEFIEYGGLPGVVIASDIQEKRLGLDDALGSYFQLDVAHLTTFHERKNLQSLMFLLSSRVGSKLDVTKLAQSLGVSRQTVYSYLEFLEATYLISLLPQYSTSSDVTERRLPKLYFTDSGILNRIGKMSLGQLFENTVYTQLSTAHYFSHPGGFMGPRIAYYQKKSGVEIDFIVDDTGYEVKTTAGAYDAARISRFAQKRGLKGYRVISLDQPRVVEKNIITPFEI